MSADASKISWATLLKRTVDAWMADKALRLSAALAYYAVFSIAPLLVITIAVAGLVLGDEAVAGNLHAQMTGYIGSPAAAALQSMVESAAKPADGVAATVTGFVVLMLGASGVFGALKDGLNTIWEVKPKEGVGVRAFAQEKFLNFGMVLVIGFLLLVSLVLSTAIAGLHHRLETVVALPPFVWTIATFLVSMFISTILFAWIFKVLPDVRLRWRDVWVGAFLTSVLFEVGKTGLSWYLGRESTANAYGAAGSVVLLLLWVYYASCILLFGAEFTRVYARASGRLAAPSAGSEWTTTEDRLQEGMHEEGTQGKEPHAMPQAGAAAHSFFSPSKGPGMGALAQNSPGAKQTASDLLEPGRKTISAEMQRHSAVMMAGGMAVGLAATMLLFRRKRITGVIHSSAMQTAACAPSRPLRAFANLVAGQAMPIVMPLVVMPVLEKMIKRHLPR